LSQTRVIHRATSYGDRVMRGAFTKTLREKVPLMLWQHSALEPCGRWDVLREDSRGLYVEGRLADTSRGRDAYELFKLGAIKGLSIGFVAKESKPNATGGRDLFTVDLWEISPVSFAACPHAEVDSVKMQNRLEAAIDRLCKAIGDARPQSRPQELPDPGGLTPAGMQAWAAHQDALVQVAMGQRW